MKLYKLIYLEDLRPYEVFDQIEILDEDSFRERFWQAIDEEQISPNTAEEWGITERTARDYFLTKDMVKVFCADGYECEVLII